MAQNNTALYLLSFNNYYNRIVKRFDTVEEYMEYSVFDPLVCNFNPADGIDTEHIFNIATLQVPPSADYVLAVNEAGEIVSRWFIVNASRVRGGQFRLALHRDLVADFYTETTNAPTYIERAMVSLQSKLIFNKENLQYNQIKKSEKLLKDETGTPWIVGYVAPNAFDTPITLTTNQSTTAYVPESPISYSDITNYANKNLSAIETVRGSLVGSVWHFAGNVIGSYQVGSWYMTYDQNALYSYGKSLYGTQAMATRWMFYGKETWQTEMVQTTTQFQQKFANVSNAPSILLNQAKACLDEDENRTYVGWSEYQTLLGMLDTWYVDSGTIFRIVKESNAKSVQIQYDNIRNGEYFNTVANIVGQFGDSHCDTIGLASTTPSKVGLEVYVDELSFRVETMSSPQIGTTITSTVSSLNDAPYKMFAIPAKLPTCDVLTGLGNSIKSSLTDYMGPKIATQLATQLSAGETSFIYDIQILPYLPVRSMLYEGSIVLGGTEGVDYTFIREEDKSGSGPIKSFILWATSSSFSFTLNGTGYQIAVPQSSAIDFKIDHETKFCRLVAPNYSSVFEFKPTSNMGVSGFEINATYKPYQPYIHVNPLFNENGLYGGDFNDNRGLICSGDYSFPILTNAWQSYQIQNKSYYDSFTRQIENLDVNYQLQYDQMKKAGTVNAITSGISGATAGAMSGSLGGPIGGTIGAGVGFMAGLGASIYGLNADLDFLSKQQQETRNYTRDQFALSLQNIRALPSTISKISAFDINNKSFPFVEFYTATTEEETALRNKITYNSMTVNVIGKITDYVGPTPTFIQGSVIRLDDLGEDYHLAVAIADEIHKGVYI